MDPLITSSLIGAGASLAGGFFGNKSKADADRKNYEMQKEFAQNGIRWRVADARAAGLHPLAALGMSPSAASPSFQAGDTSFLHDFGQNIGRAVQAGMTRAERAATANFENVSRDLSLEKQRAEIDVLKSEVRKNDSFMANQLADNLVASNRAVHQSGLGPSFPSAGASGRLGYTSDVPAFTNAITSTGSRVTIPNPDVAEALEENFLARQNYNFRAYLPELGVQAMRKFYNYLLSKGLAAGRARQDFRPGHY